jgi:WD40 repeat protein
VILRSTKRRGSALFFLWVLPILCLPVSARAQGVRVLEGHWGVVHSVVFSPDAKHLASMGGDQAIKIWEVETGRVVGSLAVSSGQRGGARWP